MKKLFLSLLCAISVLAVNAQTITIQGLLNMEPNPCTTEPCMPGMDLAICTTDKVYFVGNHYTDESADGELTITIDDMVFVFRANDMVKAKGVVTTHLDIFGEEYNVINITSIQSVEKESITIQGSLVTAPGYCIGGVCPTCLSLAISTTEKTYFIKGKCGETQITTTIDGVENVFEEGDEVIATGIVTTLTDIDGNESYILDITSINKPTKVDWCTQWNVMEFRFEYGISGDIVNAKTYTFVADGDTVIAEKTYTKIISYWTLKPENKEYVAAIRHQNDSVMVHYEDAEYLLYDFGVQVGDEREVFAGLNNTHYVKTFKNKVKNVSILPDGRRKILVDIYEKGDEEEYIKDHEKDWTEGIGCTWHGLLHTGGMGLPGACGNALMCAYKGTDCVYTAEIDWLNELGCVYNSPEYTALEEVQTESINAHKAIENGQLVIIRDGVRYNVLGAEL